MQFFSQSSGVRRKCKSSTWGVQILNAIAHCCTCVWGLQTSKSFLVGRSSNSKKSNHKNYSNKIIDRSKQNSSQSSLIDQEILLSSCVIYVYLSSFFFPLLRDRSFITSQGWGGEGGWRRGTVINFLRGLILGVTFKNEQNVRGVEILQYWTGLL